MQRCHETAPESEVSQGHWPDGIPARLLKEAAVEIAPAVTLLFQASLDQAKVPLSWKEALVVSVFKKGNRSSAANYRPISLTSLQVV